MPSPNLSLNREIHRKYRESVSAAESVLSAWPSNRKQAKKMRKTAKSLRMDLQSLREDIRNLLHAQKFSAQTEKNYQNMLSESKRYCQALQKRRGALRKELGSRKTLLSNRIADSVQDD